MATEHRDIPDAERHEPKGISTALEGQVYRSNGSASGQWKDDIISISGVITDVSTASSVLIPIPVDCIVINIKAVLGSAITLADSNITVTRGGDSATIATFVVPFTDSGEGTTINTNPISNETLLVDTHNYIKVATDGGSTDVAKLYVTIKLKVIE